MSVTVTYRCDVRWGDGLRRETLGASIGRPKHHDAPGVRTLDVDGQPAAVWMFPDDPGLPALRTALDPAAVGRLLGHHPVETTLRAYRPTRRAVVEATTPGGRVFLKVLRPAKAEALRRRHLLLTGAGVPVPDVLDHRGDGLLVLAPLAGTTLRDAVRTGGLVPSPRELLDVLDRLPAELCDQPRRAAWSENADYYATLVGAALPAEADRAATLADRVLDRIAGLPDDGPTHGDFYEAQLLLTGGRLTGVLDVDSAGPGRRADDLACLVAHLETLSLMPGWDGPRLRRLAREYAAAFAADLARRGTDPAELNARIAGVLLSLATGPHRVQEPDWQAQTAARLSAADAWLTPARHGSRGLRYGDPMGRIVFMCGPAGAGKSTYARRLEADGFVRLSIDAAAWAAGHREQPLAEPVRSRFEREVQERLVALAADGADVVVDLSFWSRRMRDTYRALLAPLGVVPETVYLATPRDVVLARVAARTGSHADDVVLDEATAALYSDHFEAPTADEGPLTVVTPSG
ncbi:AAA family ATPase [Xylanimonas cellulosilytica]|uniref:AAA family ATPase n=1 Tax=Xylanimonas cellulosilytica TaxID=186189 RepID=UPI00019C0C53|nr:AAA family ATPase [Xylanimonas cellulosilytica]